MAEMLEDRVLKREGILPGSTGISSYEALETMPKEQKVDLVFELLKEMQPYLSANNLTSLPPASSSQGLLTNVHVQRQ